MLDKPPFSIPRMSAFSVLISVLVLLVSNLKQKESMDKSGHIEISNLKHIGKSYLFKSSLNR